MVKQNLSAREICESDVELIASYWSDAEPAFLIGMGVDLAKMPAKDEFRKLLVAQFDRPYKEKSTYCIVWEIDGIPTGHCNINKIVFGEEAYMHLHLWKPQSRRKGLGVELIKLTVPYFFKNYKLKTLFCEPYALNPAPNKALEKAGFTFVKTYRTIPGSVGFEQQVNRWQMSRQKL
jgi:ribosomal-protein-alanine N-acetyltransferase